METNQQAESPDFISAFFRAFADLRVYPSLAGTSAWRALAHFVLLVLVASAAYAGLSASVMMREADRYLPGFLEKIPEIRIVKGKVETDVPQPYTIDIEGEPVFVLDTSDPQSQLEKHSQIAVLGSKYIFLKKSTGEVRSYPLSGNFTINGPVVEQWYQRARPWVFPVFLVSVGSWQFMGKAIQALVVAGLLALCLGGRPTFGVCWRLTTYALSPAMAWGVLVFSLRTAGVQVPLAALVFYGLLIGIPAWAASQLRSTEEGRAYH